MRNLRNAILWLATFHGGLAWAFTAPTFALDGQLYADRAGLAPLRDTGTLTLQIFDPGATCVLYEEQQSFDTTASDGAFHVEVGSAPGAAKRRGTSGLDVNNPMSLIYSNRNTVGGRTTGGGACSYNPAVGDERLVRVIVHTNSDAATRTLTPDFALSSVPTAVIAESAESFQGFSPAQFLQVNAGAAPDLTQANLESVFQNYGALSNLLTGASPSYVRVTGAGGALVPSAGTPSTPSTISASEGQIWYDSSSHTIRYSNGSQVQTVGAAGSGISSLVVGSGLTSSAGTTISDGGRTLSANAGTGANQLVQLDSSARVPAVDGSLLQNLNPALIASGTIGLGVALVTDQMVQTSGSVVSTDVRTRSSKLFNGVNFVDQRAPAGLAASYALTWPGALPAGGAKLLGADSTGQFSWVDLSAGLVTNQATLPTGAIWIGDAGNKAQPQTASGDLNLSASGAFTITALRGTPVAATAPLTSGQVLRFDQSASQYQPSFVAMTDLRSKTTGTQAFGTSCLPSQTLTYDAVSDQMSCQNIAIGNGQLNAGTVDTAALADGAVSSRRINATGIASNRLLITDASGGTTVTYAACATDEVMKFGPLGWTCASVGSLAPVTSVAGKTGAVTLNAADVGGLGTAALYDVGTGANQMVRLDGSARLPAVDGSLLTGVNAVSLQARPVAATAPTADQVLAWNAVDSAWEPVSRTEGSVTSVASGTGLLGGPITSAGTLSVDIGSGAGQVVAENASAQIIQSGGSAATPAYGFGTGAGTGLYSPGVNQLSLSTAGSSALAILASGNVGVGTNAPASILDLNGALTVRGIGSPAVSPAGQGRLYFDTAFNQFLVSQNGGAYASLVTSGGATGGQSATGAFLFTSNSDGTGSDGGFTFQNSSTNVLTVSDAGVIAVPSVVASSAPTNGAVVIGGGLGVGGNVNLGGVLQSSAVRGAGDNSSLYSATSSTATSPIGGTTGFIETQNTFASDGVGSFLNLVTTNSGGTAQRGYLGAVSTTAGQTPALVIGQQTGGSAYAERLRIDAGGRVGLGTAAPGAALDIFATGPASALILPRDSDLNRPSPAVNGMIRYNTAAASVEGFINGSWSSLATATAGGYLPLNGGTMTGSINMGGNALVGSAVSGGTLTLDSTSSITKGLVLFNTGGTGQIGIGTATPGAGLDLRYDPNAVVAGTHYPLLIAARSNGGGRGVSLGYRADGSLDAVGSLVSTGQNSPLSLSTTNNLAVPVERLRIDSVGNVAIGTSAPQSGLDVATTGSISSAIIVPRDTTGNRPTTPVNGMIRYATDTASLETYQNGAWLNVLGGSAASAPLSGLTNATAVNTIDNANFAQTWNWSTATNQTAQTLGGNALTSGSLLTLSSNSAALASTNGLLNVVNSGTSTAGVIARIQSNAATTTSGITVLANGNVGINNTAPTVQLDMTGTVRASSFRSTTVGSAGTPNFFNSLSTNDGMYFPGSNSLGLSTGGVGRLLIDSTGNVSIGTAAAVAGGVFGRRYLAVKGASDLGVIEISSGGADASGNTIGQVAFADANSVAADKRAFTISTQLSGTTATNRGGQLVFSNKSDGASGLTERMRLDVLGNLGIGTNAPQAGLDVATTGSTASAIIVPRDTLANRPTTAVNGMIRYASDTARFEVYQAGTWQNMLGGAASNAPLSGLSAATSTNAIDNLNYAQTWSWSTATAQSPLTINANALTSGSLLTLSTSNGALGSTGGLLNVANVGSSTSGLIARIQSNAIAGAGLTVLANGNVGVGTAAPVSTLNLSSNGTAALAIDSYGLIPSFVGRAAQGTMSSPTASQTDDKLAWFAGRGYGATGFGTSGVAGMYVRAAENFTDANQGGYLTFETNPVGSTTRAERVRITAAGNVGIGGTPQAGLDVSTTGNLASAIIVPRDTTGNRPTAPVNGMIRYASDTAKFEVFQGGSWLNVIGGPSSGAPFSGITAATAINAIDNANFAQTWNWTTASSQNELTLTANALTSGSVLSVTSANPTLNSTAGLLNVANLGTSTSGVVARVQANATASSGLTVFANGNVGVGTSTPTALFEVGGGAKINGTLNVTGTSLLGGSVSLLAGQLFAGTGSMAFPTIAFNSADNQVGLYRPLANTIGFSTTANERMRIDATGNVGIGTTGPTSLLQVTGTSAKTAAYTGALYQIGNTSATNAINKVGLDIESTGAWTGTGAVNTGLVVNATGGTVNYAATFTGGNVGVGTTLPASGLDVATTGPLGSAIIVPRDTVANRPSPAVNGMIRYASDTNSFEVFQNNLWQNMLGGAASNAPLSGITSATAVNTIDNLNFAQTWNWSTATSQTAHSKTGNALTFGTLLSLTTASPSLNSANGLLNVANTGTSLSGIVARVQSNGNAASSGLTVLASGNVGIGTTAPTAPLNVIGASSTLGNTSFLRMGNSDLTDGIAIGNLSGQAARMSPTLVGQSNQTQYTGLQLIAKGSDAGTFPLMMFNSSATTGDIMTGGQTVVTARDLFSFQSNNNVYMRITAAGAVGVGTVTPSSPLEVVDSVTAGNGITNTTSSTGSAAGALFTARRARGNTLPAVLAGDRLGTFAVAGHNGTSFNAPGAVMTSYAAENLSTTTNGSALAFETTAIGTTTRSERVRIDPAGNVGIGTSIPTSALQVNGTVTATSFSGPMTSTGYAQSSGNFTMTGTSAVSQTYNGTGPAHIITDVSNASGDVLDLVSTSTSAANNDKGLSVAISGANASGVTRYGVFSNVTATGTTSTNVAGYFSASGSNVNYGLLVPAGNVGIGTTTPASPLHVNTAVTGTSGSSFGIQNAMTYSPAAASTGAVYAQNNTLSVGGTTNISAIVMGTQNSLNNVNSGTLTNLWGTYNTVSQSHSAGTTNLLAGTYNEVVDLNGTIATVHATHNYYRNANSGTVTNAVGTWNEMRNVSSGTTSNAIATQSVIYTNGTGAITNAYGYFASAPSVTTAGTMGSYYGVYIQTPTAATTNYAIYSQGGNNYFGGAVGIGSASPTSILQVNDSSAKTASYTGVLHQVSNTSSTASINKVGLDVESTGAWSGTGAVNTGLVVNATGGTTNYAATFTGGSVGIGTTTPAQALDVVGAVRGTSLIVAGAGLLSNGSSDLILNANGGTNNLSLQAGGTERVRILANGNVGIGVSPTTKLQVAGEISPSADNTYPLGDSSLRFSTVYAANGLIQTSDERLKRDVEPARLGLDFITKLRPVSFRWREGEDQTSHYGLIAQEVRRALNEMVAVDPRAAGAFVKNDQASDRLGLIYSELVTPLITAVQELYAKVLGHGERLDAHDRALAELRESVARRDQVIEDLRREIQKLNGAAENRRSPRARTRARH